MSTQATRTNHSLRLFVLWTAIQCVVFSVMRTHQLSGPAEDFALYAPTLVAAAALFKAGRTKCGIMAMMNVLHGLMHYFFEFLGPKSGLFDSSHHAAPDIIMHALQFSYFALVLCPPSTWQKHKQYIVSLLYTVMALGHLLNIAVSFLAFETLADHPWNVAFRTLSIFNALGAACVYVGTVLGGVKMRERESWIECLMVYTIAFYFYARYNPDFVIFTVSIRFYEASFMTASWAAALYLLVWKSPNTKEKQEIPLELKAFFSFASSKIDQTMNHCHYTQHRNRASLLEARGPRRM